MPLFPAGLFLESLTFDLAGSGVMKDLQRSFVAAETTRLPRRLARSNRGCKCDSVALEFNEGGVLAAREDRLTPDQICLFVSGVCNNRMK